MGKDYKRNGRVLYEERGKREEDGNNSVGILTRDSRSDLRKIKVVGPDRAGRKRSGALRELED